MHHKNRERKELQSKQTFWRNIYKKTQKSVKNFGEPYTKKTKKYRTQNATKKTRK